MTRRPKTEEADLEDILDREAERKRALVRAEPKPWPEIVSALRARVAKRSKRGSK